MKKINNKYIFVLIVFIFILSTILFKSINKTFAQFMLPERKPSEGTGSNIIVNPLKEDLNLGGYSVIGEGNIDINGNINSNFNTIGDLNLSGDLSIGGNVTSPETDFTINDNVDIGRHLDAMNTWGVGSRKTLFLGWGGGKVVLGNNIDDGHNWVHDIDDDAIGVVNPLYAYRSISNYGTPQYDQGMSTYVMNTQHWYPADNGANQTMYAGISDSIINIRGSVTNSEEDFTINDNVDIGRHLDAMNTWGVGSRKTLFLGWGGGKVVLGNNIDGGHNWVHDIDDDAIGVVNPLYAYTNVGIGTTDASSHRLTVVGTNTNHLGAAIYASRANPTGNSSNDYGYAIRGQIGSGTGWAIGVGGDSTSGSPSSNGRAFGIYGKASNATSNFNYGVFGMLEGSNAGAAITGWDRINYPNWSMSTDGSWAGYFQGDVKIVGNLSGGDINLSNEDRDPNEVDGTRGSWSIQEGDNNLFLINRNTGEKYKFVLNKVK